MLSSHSPNGFALELGARVRALRHERGLTLKGLGSRAGLSHPFLSQVERGLAHPSVNSVERIAAALDVSVARLWAAPPVAKRIRLIRSDEGVWKRPGLRQLPGDTGAPVLREWTSRGRRWPADYTTDEGEMAVYVARGAVEVDLNGDVHALAEGDALRFDGSTPHRFRRAGGPNTRALIVTPP